MNLDEEEHQLRGIAEMLIRSDPVLARRLTGGPNRHPGVAQAAHAALAGCVVLSVAGVIAHQGQVVLLSCLLLMTVYPLLLVIKSRP